MAETIPLQDGSVITLPEGISADRLLVIELPDNLSKAELVENVVALRGYPEIIQVEKPGSTIVASDTEAQEEFQRLQMAGAKINPIPVPNGDGTKTIHYVEKVNEPNKPKPEYAMELVADTLKAAFVKLGVQAGTKQLQAALTAKIEGGRIN